ncbi:Pantothenate transporter liz1 [Apiospora arundinis]
MNPLMIGDIKEKETKSPPSAELPTTQKRQDPSAADTKSQPPNAIPSKTSPASDGPNIAPRRDGGGAGPVQQSSQADEKSSIDRENSERLASMSPEEIEAARQELFNGMDESLLQRLLKRANLDEQNGPSAFMGDKPAEQPASQDSDAVIASTPNTTDMQDKDVKKEVGPKTPKKKVTFETPYVEDEDDTNAPPTSNQQGQPIVPPTAGDDDDDDAHQHTKTHWPEPPQIPDLDPSDPNFLESLHAKYFPNLPADPSKLAWMAPIPTTNSPADFDSPYHPRHSSIPISQLRFDFRGTLLPPAHRPRRPRLQGAVPGQRCIAYQTLGRILFRLGRGEFGRDDVADGIWATIQESRVMESIREEANVDPADFAAGNMVGDGRGRGHRSAYAFAVEAMWLFEKGGWRERLRRGK